MMLNNQTWVQRVSSLQSQIIFSCRKAALAALVWPVVASASVPPCLSVILMTASTLHYDWLKNVDSFGRYTITHEQTCHVYTVKRLFIVKKAGMQ